MDAGGDKHRVHDQGGHLVRPALLSNHLHHLRSQIRAELPRYVLQSQGEGQLREQGMELASSCVAVAMTQGGDHMSSLVRKGVMHDYPPELELQGTATV